MTMKIKSPLPTGSLVAALLLVGLLALGVYLPSLPSRELPKDPTAESFPALIPSADPRVMEEQMKIRSVALVSRRLSDDYVLLQSAQNQMPDFKPPADEHLTAADFKKYSGAYNDFTSELGSFKHNVAARPGAVRLVALYGMIEEYTEVVRIRAMVNNQLSEDQFEWIQSRIMQAALYCVLHQLQLKDLPEPDRRRFEGMVKQLKFLSRVIEKNDQGEDIDYSNERLPALLGSIPRNNLQLFLDNYRIIDYANGVHFTKPSLLTFDREGIMAQARNNPP
jgi:hypothetical protein